MLPYTQVELASDVRRLRSQNEALVADVHTAHQNIIGLERDKHVAIERAIVAESALEHAGTVRGCNPPPHPFPLSSYASNRATWVIDYA